jgi:type II secretory pathway component PulF
MQQGASLPDAFAATGLFSNQVENLIITGHHSGEVVESLDRIANYYAQQADETAGKSKFAMLRLGFLGMLVFGGGALCWLTYSYYHGMFRFVEQSFGLD